MCKNPCLMEDIEMDSPTAEPTSGWKRGSMSPLPSHTTTFAALHMRQRLQKASKNPRKMTAVLSTVLKELIDALSQTSAKVNFISVLTRREADRFVEDERQELEDRIRTCMESRDWSDLITHRMYAVTLQDVFFDHGHSEISVQNTVTTGDTARTYIRPREGQETGTFIKNHMTSFVYLALQPPRGHGNSLSRATPQLAWRPITILRTSKCTLNFLPSSNLREWGSREQ